MRKRKAKPKIRNDTMVKVRKVKGSTNKKVKNARITIIDGIKFRSNLEAFTYKALKESGLKFEYEPYSFVLIPQFNFNGEKVRSASYKPDFVGDDWIIEVKGFETDAFKIRWKLFKWKLVQEDLNYRLFLPKNQKQVLKAIEQIVKKEYDSDN